jgi:hypothetical protein
VAKYRKRPIVIEAEQWWPGDHIEGVKYKTEYTVEDADGERIVRLGPYIMTFLGVIDIAQGDWIITGEACGKYPCKPRIFDEMYEPLEA